MLSPYEDPMNPGDTLFRDVLSLALLGFLAVIVLLLPHIVTEGKEEVSTVSPSGDVVVELTWPSHMDADMDLWVRAPGDITVGYSNKGGKIFNLLRDDLGKTLDLSSINHESAYSRGFAKGEYTVNVHAYRLDPRYPPPFTVEIVVSTKTTAEGAVRVVPIIFTRAQIRHQGQELTLARFELTERGELVEGSIHSLFKPLRQDGIK
ncbi:MAG: hypothetical protein F4Z15_08510 [Gammaproteobacteria bacterium]|nr:hypothetical protein [Gammaproteobacteria bacterium]MYD77129.1 hypothetical protein [Gammaproteobacteria bacterium]MYJ52715.1 hypothetical protein [Gammaproteobacteria bacterium]